MTACRAPDPATWPEDAEPKGETQPESKEDAGGEAMFFVAPTGFGLVGTF